MHGMAERVHRITSLGSGAPREGSTGAPEDASAAWQAGQPDPTQAQTARLQGGRAEEPPADTGRAQGVERGIDLVLAIQRPIVLAHLRGIRRRVPNATPDQLVRILERRYLTAVTTGGAAVGATAVIPGISTGITLALSGVETAGFLEATALFAQSVAEVHGIPVENPDRARALVMTLMLGREGVDLVRQFAGQASGSGPARNVFWGELITNSMPKALMGTVVERLRHVFIRQFAVRGGAGIIGKAIPFGIGAAIGGTGNHLLGRKVLQQSRLAFGPPPPVLPAALEPREGDSLIRSTGSRITRAGAAVGELAASTGRGIRDAASKVGRGITRRRSSGDDADANEPTADGRGDEHDTPPAQRAS